VRKLNEIRDDSRRRARTEAKARARPNVAKPAPAPAVQSEAANFIAAISAATPSSCRWPVFAGKFGYSDFVSFCGCKTTGDPRRRYCAKHMRARARA
jgi:hypothetical protein